MISKPDRYLRLGLLHTAEIHQARFDALLSHESDATAVHLSAPALLQEAINEGLTDKVMAKVRAAVDSLVSQNVDGILCTCSTLGDLVEQLSSPACPCLRIDRPMALSAVTHGESIGVLVSVASTLAPTWALFEDSATSTGTQPEIKLYVAEGAWEAFERGDTETYLALVRAAAQQLLRAHDVVALAQVSMADAAHGLLAEGKRVLSSPESGLQHMLALLRERSVRS
ncbi:MAG: hypothetical protein KDI36_10245 [Pseudomonadales bacterium]|nr:hypothetical protein [Pseudomonadales bacterium]